MNYVELHIGDYEKATAHLTACEDGIYGRLMRRYYDTEAPLPLDLKAVQRLVRARSRDERAAVETILDEFFRETPEGWRHGRCDAEIAKFQEKRAKAKRSAEARWSGASTASDRNANASPDAMRTHSEGNAHQTPDTRRQSPDLVLEGSNTDPPSAAVAGEHADRVGYFEGHPARPVAPRALTPNPVAAFAIALRAVDVQVTALNPDLIAYHADGGTADDLVALAKLETFAGKPATYIIRAARRMLAEGAPAVTGGSNEDRSRSGDGRSSRGQSLADRARAHHDDRSAGRSEPEAAGVVIDGTATRVPT